VATAGQRLSDEHLRTLAHLPHFRTLPPAALARVAACCRLRTLRKGETLFTMGEPARAFYALHAGAVRVYRTTESGRQQVMHNLHAGQSFAEPAVFSYGRYPVHAEARTTPTEVVAIDGAAFLKVLASDPAIAPAVIGALCQRLREMIERVEELAVAGAPARLARWLLEQPARPGPGGVLRVELATSKKDLAAELALAPETMSRLLRRLAGDGAIRVQGRRIDLVDPEALSAIAGGSGP
jgi:CRP/FNR family transcriptional regulator